MTPEGHVLAKILVYLAGRPDVFVWRQNTGKARVRNRAVAFGRRGCADIIGTLSPNGRFLAVEAKAPGAVQSPEQIEFQKDIERHGGLYILAYSVQDVASALGAISAPFVR